MEEINCSVCGARVPSEGKFCPACGARIEERQPPAYAPPAYAPPAYAPPAYAPAQAAAPFPAVSVKPVGVFSWLLTIAALAVPVVNLVCAFIWAFGAKTNGIKKNFARAWLIFFFLCLVLFLVWLFINWESIGGFLKVISS